MAYSGCMEDVRTCVNGGVPKRLPVFLCSEEADVRISPYTYEQYATDSKVMAEVAISAVKRFDYDWAWLQVDDCILVELLGVGVKGEGDILRATCEYLPATRNALDSLPRPNVKRDGRCKILLDAIKAIKDEFAEDICVVGRTEAPFSSVGLTFGLDNTMMLTVEDPQFILDAEEYFVELQTEFGLAQIEAGADAIWFGDCNGASHLIRPSRYRELGAEPAGRVLREYQRAGGLTFWHNSEEVVDGFKVQSEQGPSAISVGPGGSLAEAREAVGPKQCLMGNIDPIRVLERGAPDDVAEAVRDVVTNISVKGAHLLNSGEMVPHATPEANIEAMISTARSCWKELVGG